MCRAIAKKIAELFQGFCQLNRLDISHNLMLAGGPHNRGKIMLTVAG